MTRRSFLIRMLLLLMALCPVALSPWIDWKSLFKRALKTRKSSGFSELDWQTLEAVQGHLFPSEADSPGAKEIQALRYLHLVVAHEELDADDREQIRKGLTTIETLSEQSAKTSFVSLSEKQREEVLRRFEITDEGQQWLTVVLNYIFEALLGDPVYGGNPKGLGWKWLGIRSGFPRPTVGKRYYELL